MASARELTLDADCVAVLADCHIDLAAGRELPPLLMTALGDSDLIVTLGDMGEAVALDQLEEIATVIGLRGEDDEHDPRTDNAALLLHIAGARVGCVFDPVAAGLATSLHPFAASDGFEAACAALFGGPPDILLYASTHRPDSDGVGPTNVLALNPGSASLPLRGAPPTYLRLYKEEGRLQHEIVFLG